MTGQSKRSRFYKKNRAACSNATLSGGECETLKNHFFLQRGKVFFFGNSNPPVDVAEYDNRIGRLYPEYVPRLFGYHYLSLFADGNSPCVLTFFSFQAHLRFQQIILFILIIPPPPKLWSSFYTIKTYLIKYRLFYFLFHILKSFGIEKIV